ncbi:MAG: hypothetical protein KME55_25590, partial [Nostoc indistinguendum CM1-VF10]|nr:hypothetical protein [Nostoc indistinguendum CM1-VF10]
DYLSVLSVWVDQALISNRSVASDLSQAHQWLRRIADCLHYPKKLLANKNITFIVIQLAQYKLWLINIRNFLLCLSLKS